LASLEKKHDTLRTQHDKLKSRTASWEVNLREKTSSLESTTKELIQLRELKQQQSAQLFEYEESLRLQQIGIDNMNAEIDELQEQNSELNRYGREESWCR
jgi:chromosome segregation ATPase